MIGKRISHYRILEKIGEGGMGVVYKARDEHLDRFVALKLLPPERLADPERRLRFVQEAKSASALNHPNIIHIYDVTESEGTLFLAMEYVLGRTLGQLIGRKGIPLGDALKYATQIADALAKAHSAGIVHRDLKPSNIMVAGDGLVKILDFGLAKLTEATGAELAETRSTRHVEAPRTSGGVILGTAAYMSPERRASADRSSPQRFQPRDSFALASRAVHREAGQRQTALFLRPPSFCAYNHRGRGQVMGCIPPSHRGPKWVRLMRRVFALDVLQCSSCGGKMRSRPPSTC